MSEYVTEEDLEFPDCDCGHWLGKHSIVPHRHTARLIECDCRKTSVDLTLDHWDQVVRREVAKALDEAAAALSQRRDDVLAADHSLLGRVMNPSLNQIYSDARRVVVRLRDRVREEGQ